MIPDAGSGPGDPHVLRRALFDAQQANAAAEAIYNNDGDSIWPWPEDDYKPKDRRRDLVRAAALLLAEIERLDRAKSLAALAGADACVKQVTAG